MEERINTGVMSVDIVWSVRSVYMYVMSMRRKHRVLGMKKISADTRIMRIERRGLDFSSGQYICLGPESVIDMREYSVYSSPAEDHLDVLFREIETGYVSKLLAGMKPGEHVNIDGPFGEFVLPPDCGGTEFLFIATGTGISPFHSIIASRPDISYTLLHGCRTVADCYESHIYDSYIPCITREASAYSRAYRGRVTEYLENTDTVIPDHIYACGNSDMIYDVFSFFRRRDYPRENLHAEIYF